MLTNRIMSADDKSAEVDWTPYAAPDYEGTTIPFIVLDEDTGFYSVTEEAVTFLSLLPSGFGVVTIVGRYRTGKSFLLNRCLLESTTTGFDVGPTIQRCTMGLWISTKLLMSPEGYPVVVMDTEGIGSLDSDNTHDTRIFALALLLSSYFIYNSVGSIDEAAVQNLSLVLNISREIHLHSDQTSTTNPDDLCQYFPEFLWVVRDFTLLLQDKDGNDITTNNYLESALTCASSDKIHEIEAKDDVRRLIRHYFPKRECVTMVRPCLDETDLQNMNAKSDTCLRPEFMAQMTALRQQVLASTLVKTVNGSSISGSIYSELSQSLIKSINSGHAPAVVDTWNMIREIQLKQMEEEVLDTWSTECQWIYQTPAVLVEPLDLEESSSKRISELVESINDGACERRLTKKLEEKALRTATLNERNIELHFANAVRSVDQKTHTLEKTDALRSLLGTVEEEALAKISISDPSRSLSIQRWKTAVLDAMWVWLARFTAEWDEAMDKKNSSHRELEGRWEMSKSDHERAQKQYLQTIVARDEQVKRLQESVAQGEEALREQRRAQSTEVDETVRLLRIQLASWDKRWSDKEEEDADVEDKRSAQVQDLTLALEKSTADDARARVLSKKQSDTIAMLTEEKAKLERSLSDMIDKRNQLADAVEQRNKRKAVELERLQEENESLSDLVHLREKEAADDIQRLAEATAATLRERSVLLKQSEQREQQMAEEVRGVENALASERIKAEQLQVRWGECNNNNTKLEEKVQALETEASNSKAVWAGVLTEQQLAARDTLSSTTERFQEEIDRVRQQLDHSNKTTGRQLIESTEDLHKARAENVRLQTVLDEERKHWNAGKDKAQRKRERGAKKDLEGELQRSEARQLYLHDEVERHSVKSRERLEQIRELRTKMHQLEKELAVAKYKRTVDDYARVETVPGCHSLFTGI